MPILKKSGKLLNIVLAVSILVLGIFVVALGNVKASADETSQEAAVGENFVNSFNEANYKFNPNKPGIFQWQSVDDVFLMVVD